MGQTTFQRIVIVLLVGVVCAMGYYIYNGGFGEMDADPKSQTKVGLQTEADFRDKLTELNMQRDKVQKGIARLESLKMKTLKDLRDKGIKTGEDFRNSEDKEVKLAAVSLKEYAEKIAKIESEVSYYDDAIAGLKAMLERIERERIGESVSLSETDYLALQKIIAQLDDNLKVDIDVFEEQELIDLIDNEIDKADN